MIHCSRITEKRHDISQVLWVNAFILLTDSVASTVKKLFEFTPMTSCIACANWQAWIIFLCEPQWPGPSLAKWIRRGDQLSYKQSQEFWSSIIEWGALSTNCLKPWWLRCNLKPRAHLTGRPPAHTGSSVGGWCCNTSQSLCASRDVYWARKWVFLVLEPFRILVWSGSWVKHLVLVSLMLTD